MKSAVPFVHFVEQVLRVELTPAQRVLALVGFDGVEPIDLRGADRALATALFGPIDTVPQSARGVLAIVKGARVGGTYVFGALYSLWRALTADISKVAPGEQVSAIVVAPDTRLARQCLRFALGAARSVQAIGKLIKAETADGFVIHRPDGHRVAVEALPATRGGSALRGRTLVSAVQSESSFFRDESAAVNDVDCFQAVAPRVVKGGMVVLESTPWAETGLLFDIFSKNFGEPSTALAAHAPTLLMRPDETTREIVEREKARDPDNYEREFGAAFISGGSGLFFGSIELQAALDRELRAIRTIPSGWTAFIGADIGLVKDSTAAVAIHAHPDGRLRLADAIEFKPRGKPLRLADIMPALCEFAARHGKKTIFADHHLLSEARQHLAPGGFALRPVAGGQDAKTARHVRARSVFKDERIKIPVEFSRVITQLSEIVARPQPGGGTSLTSPRRRGSHADLAAAAIVALGELGKPRNRMTWALEEGMRQNRVARLRAAVEPE
ncbi:MAG TPA: hypothetical protein VIK01_14140 [Polyangiaceae bacterium]